MSSRRPALAALAAAAAAAVAAFTTPWSSLRAAPVAAIQGAGGTPKLARGLNLTHWFEYERGQPVNAAEMQQMRALGLDHVRIPVDPVVGGWDPVKGGRLAFLPELQAAVALALDAGLEVVIDLHLEPADKKRIEDQPATETQLVALWTQLAGAFAKAPRDKLAFELFNEPQYYGLQRRRWPPLQRRLLAAVRAVAPQHLVLLAAHGGGAFEALAEQAPENDANLAYVFHHYEPFLFTHQGAAWMDERYTTAGLRRGLRYPPDPATDARSVPLRPHPKAASELADYLKSGWGPQRMHSEMARIGAWARGKGLRVVCNEFGVIREHVDPASRYRWIADVRGALEAAGIGWTLWDYTDIFGITAQSAQLGRTGRRSIEPAALAALGLVAGTRPR